MLFNTELLDSLLDSYLEAPTVMAACCKENCESCDDCAAVKADTKDIASDIS